MRCLVCDTELTPVSRHSEVQCHGAVTFRARGNHGSTVFDPFGDEHSATLVVVICDGCLVARCDRVTEMRLIKQLPTYESKPWQPDLDDEDRVG